MLRRIFEFQRDLVTGALRTTIRTVGNVTGVPLAVLPFISNLYSSDEGAAHPFLSPGWIDAAREIRESYRGRATSTPPAARVNLVVTDVPFGDEVLHAHVDSTGGDVEMDLGHLDDAELTVTLAYDLAKKILVDTDVQAAMQAFMSGRITVTGDVAKLLALQTLPVEPLAIEAAARVRAITA